MSQIVKVPLSDRSYEIRIGNSLFERIGEEISPFLARPRIAAIVDEGAARFHLERLRSALADSGIECAALTLPSGEATKSWSRLQETVEWLIEQRIERNDIVLAVGGGVIGDLAGFAAAVLRRGVGCIQVPTTLLAQVDSSVGGKTGINSPAGKNLIGAFHQPRLVICDVGLLRTLPRRDFLAGCGEVAKYGLIRDRRFFSWLEAHTADLGAASPGTVAAAVKRSCEIKAELVSQDEREQGIRSLLNLGHTFGHALEAACGYSGRLLHGEAVAIGCCLAFELSRRLGFCGGKDVTRTQAFFRSMGMKTAIHEIKGGLPDADGLIRHMRQDKKVISGQLRFVLAKRHRRRLPDRKCGSGRSAENSGRFAQTVAARSPNLGCRMLPRARRTAHSSGD